MPNILIYKHTSPSGKSYIGQTCNYKKRIREHCNNTSVCRAFRNAIQKYGWGNFKTDILVQNLTLEQANLLEEKYIAEYNTLAPNGYNLTSGGKNYRASDETRAQSSAAKKGRQFSNEHKAKLSAARLGKHQTVETKAKISAAGQGNQHRLGKHQTVETKAKISATLKGIHRSGETKAKISAAVKRRWQEVL